MDERIAAIIQGTDIIKAKTPEDYDPAHPTSDDEDEKETDKEEPKPKEEEEEPIIDDDELHNLLGV